MERQTWSLRKRRALGLSWAMVAGPIRVATIPGAGAGRVPMNQAVGVRVPATSLTTEEVLDLDSGQCKDLPNHLA